MKTTDLRKFCLVLVVDKGQSMFYGAQNKSPIIDLSVPSSPRIFALFSRSAESMRSNDLDLSDREEHC